MGQPGGGVGSNPGHARLRWARTTLAVGLLEEGFSFSVGKCCWWRITPQNSNYHERNKVVYCSKR